jgi:hypothetical protein
MVHRFLLLAFLLLGVIPSFAQVTSGSLSGFVTDEKKEGMAGATIKATHLPSGTVYGNSTRSDGSYSIENMRTGGPYKIEVFFMGYETSVYDDIIITLGESYNLNVNLAPGGKELSAIAVSAKRSASGQHTGASTIIGQKELNEIPTITRSLTDFTRLSPQSGPSFASGLNNSNTFAGRDGRYNNVQINGANFNNAFGLSSSLLPGGAQPVSLDALAEVRVGISPFDVRQSGFTGANINAITRSGTNTLTGSAYLYGRNQNFTGSHVGDADLPPQGGTSNSILGLRIGGPLIKNKLFFFINAEQERFVYPGVSWVAARGGVPGQNVSRTAADSLDMVADYLKEKFGYDPGAYEGYADKFTNKVTRLLARIDWNINTRHKLYISYSQMNAMEDQLVNPTSAAGSRLTNGRIGASSLVFANSNYSYEHVVRSLSGELTSNLTGRISNQLIATYSYVRDLRKLPGTLFPFVDIATGPANINDNQMSFGTDLFSYQNDVKNTNFSVIDNMSYQAGRHYLTMGIGYESTGFGNSFRAYGTGYYRYASVSDFVNNKAPVVFGYTYPYEEQDGNSYVKVNYGQGSIYLQDRFNISQNLNVTGGLRLELPFYPYELPGNKYIDTLNLPDEDGTLRHYDVSQWPKQKLLISPRLSFKWDVLGDRTIQLRGGTGIFNGRVPFVWFTNQPNNSGTLTNQVQITNAAVLSNFNFNPDGENPLSSLSQDTINKYFPQHAGQSVPGQIAVVSPGFRMPSVWRTNLAVDYKLPYDLLITAEFLYTKDLIGVYQRNANLPAPSGVLQNGNDQRPYWKTSRIYSNISGVYVLENTDQGQSYSGTIGIARQAAKGLNGMLYYTASYAEDVSSNPGSQPNTTWNALPNTSSPNDQVLSVSEYLTPHRIVAALSYRVEYLKHFATTISVFYEGASLGRFNYLYGTDINKDGTNADLIYIPNDASELQWADIKDKNGNVLYTAQQQMEAFNAYMSQDDYLNEHRGRTAEKYGAKYPFYSRFDLKLLQDMYVNIGKRRHTLQLSLDMLNVGNFLNHSWGVQKRLAVGAANSSPILSVSAAGDETKQPVYQLPIVTDSKGKISLPTTTFVDNVNTLSTWSMQLGVRYIF